MIKMVKTGWKAPDETPIPSHPLRKDAPENAAEEIGKLAATGFSKRGIASHFGVGLAVLQRWIDEDDTLQEAFNVGRDQERYSLHNALYRKAMNGDSVAAMFLLKARHGYREGDQADQANKVSITFQLPGAMKMDEYKVIDANHRTERLPATSSIDTGRV